MGVVVPSETGMSTATGGTLREYVQNQEGAEVGCYRDMEERVNSTVLFLTC